METPADQIPGVEGTTGDEQWLAKENGWREWKTLRGCACWSPQALRFRICLHGSVIEKKRRTLRTWMAAGGEFSTRRVDKNVWTHLEEPPKGRRDAEEREINSRERVQGPGSRSEVPIADRADHRCLIAVSGEDPDNSNVVRPRLVLSDDEPWTARQGSTRGKLKMKSRSSMTKPVVGGTWCTWP